MTRRYLIAPALAATVLFALPGSAAAAPVTAKWYTVCDLNKPNPYPLDFVLTHAQHANSRNRNVRIAITSAKSMYGTFLRVEGIDARSLPENGRFDRATVAAMKLFQREKGIKATGKIGSLTWAALGEYCKVLV